MATLMGQILNFLGFTGLSSTLWNLLGYVGMILIIIAVVSPKWQKWFFVLGPLALLFYAWFYLHNPLLIGLEIIITASGILNLRNIKKPAPFIVIALAIAVFIALLVKGEISGIWSWFGALGLLGIALGLTQLPRKRGFIIMMAGGLLIAVYAFAFQVWIFFILNIIFFGANLREIRKK